MRKKILIMSMSCLAAMTIKAEPVHQYEDSIIHQKTFSQEPMLLSDNLHISRMSAKQPTGVEIGSLK